MPQNTDKPNAWRIYTADGEHIATVYDASMRDAYIRDGYIAKPVSVKDPRW